MPDITGLRSIRSSLFLWLLPLSAMFMVIAWLAHGALMDAMLSNFLDGRLQEEAAYIESEAQERYPDLQPLFEDDVFFGSAFHHIFAIRIEGKIWTNRPDLQTVLANGMQGTETESVTLDTGEARLYAVRTSFRVDALEATILVAENLENLEADQARLHAWVAAVSFGLLLMLVALIVMAVQFSLRPLKRLGHELAQLRSGKIERLGASVPAEFEALVKQLNRLLDTMDMRLRRSREALANLSHSIKTPIAAMGQILSDTTAEISGDLRLQMISRLDTIHEQLEAELRRGRLAGPQAGNSTDPVSKSRELVWMFGRLYPDKVFELVVDPSHAGRWAIEAQDFNELLGNIMDNAGKWASRMCRVSIATTNNAYVLSVADDGAGVPENRRSQLGGRGMRLDEQEKGHGLGLAIAREVVARYGGTVAFESDAVLDGLLVIVTLPDSGQNPTEFDE